MKTITCVEPNQLAMTEKNMPTARDGEAVVRIRRIGICGTDMHAYRGRQPFFTYPRVLGHELAGEIAEIAGSAGELSIGQQVAVLPYLECGRCIACRQGRTNCCTDLKVIGVHQDGGMCEYLTVPTSHLVPTPGITAEQTAIVEPLSISAHAVRRAQPQPGDTVLVIGAGPIGLGVMKYAKLAGARVIAMDINEDRLRFCTEWVPVDDTVNAMQQPEAKLADLTDGDMPSLVFDATGNKQSMMKAFDLVAHAGKLIYVGLVKDEITFHDPDFHKKELTLFSSRNATRQDFEFVIESIRNEDVHTDAFITHRTSFDDLIDRFEDWLRPESGVIKAMVDVE